MRAAESIMLPAHRACGGGVGKEKIAYMENRGVGGGVWPAPVGAPVVKNVFSSPQVSLFDWISQVYGIKCFLEVYAHFAFSRQNSRD